MSNFTRSGFNGLNASHGFTLVELMVALVISLFLMGGVILMYTSSKGAYLDSNQLSRLQENIRFASDYLVRDLRNAGFRDELTLTLGEEMAIRNKVAEIKNDGSELLIRYAGRGHCQDEFDEYKVVENRYYLDADTGELRCAGAEYPGSASYDPTNDPGFTDGLTGAALVEGLSGLTFELIMADTTTETGAYECVEPTVPFEVPGDHCIGVRVGLEFVGLRDLDNAGEFESRFVELISTFRNSAIDQIYATHPDS